MYYGANIRLFLLTKAILNQYFTDLTQYYPKVIEKDSCKRLFIQDRKTISANIALIKEIHPSIKPKHAFYKPECSAQLLYL